MDFDLENPLPFSHDEPHLDTLSTLFNTETHHMPSQTYLKNLENSGFNINIRESTISIISQISHPFDSPFLSYLAINYLDRFLCFHSLSEPKPWILRLIAVSCVSLALKMRKTESSVTDIQQDGGTIFDIETIKRMELLILGSLKWRMRSITAFAFVNYFASMFKFKDLPLQQAFKTRATEIIFTAQNDVKILQFKPSIISATALLCASHELFPLQFSCYKTAILNCSYVHKDDLLNCYTRTQKIVQEGYESKLETLSSSCTPVNVLDVQMSWSARWGSPSSDQEAWTMSPLSKRGSECIPCPMSLICLSDREPEEDTLLNAISRNDRQENLTKRRKIITTIIDDNT